MGFTFRIEYIFLLVVAVAFVPSVAAFGAGDIPEFAFLEGKAFRHGDIEGVLEELYKNAGKGGGFGQNAAGFLMGVASALAHGGKGQKFSKNDVKRVYFGNWLRDYSQAVDIAGLSKLTLDSLVIVISVLGFLTFGYATEEYEVTKERIGCYLCTEHIDNPKGYGEKEGDARQFYDKLRPPVDPRELEIDQNNGMKNYIATENQGWDTSTALVRRTLTECINKARSSGMNDGPELYEAYRLLGTALHTMEDLLAHSNWCELTLLKMGHEVFCHVGDNVKVNTPNGQAPPLVTGTFGGADFLHSLLGESQDHLSESSIVDLSAKMKKAKQEDSGGKVDAIKALISQIPASGGGDDKMQQGEEMKKAAIDINPDSIAPEEVQQRLKEILVWRDGTMRDISKVIENVPGLEQLVEELNLALMEYVYTCIEPFMTPILEQVTGVLKEGSDAVINTDDQFEVFTNPDASDPTHSMLSKDHFGLILNEPAGKVAKVVVEHSVNVIVAAWTDQNQDPNEAINKVLEAMHHPYYSQGTEVQNAMFEEFNKWFGGLGSDQTEVISRLSKESVREHKHVRIGSEDPTAIGTGHSHTSASQPRQTTQTQYGSGGGYQSSQQTYGQQQSTGYGSSTRDETSSYNNQESTDYSSYGESRQTESTKQSYGGGGYGSSRGNEYGSSRNNDTEYSSSRQENTGYGSRGDENEGYGRSRRDPEATQYGSSYNREETTGYGGYGSTRDTTESYSGGYGSRNDGEEHSSHHKKSGHGGGYGSSRNNDDESSETRSYGGGEERESSGYGGGYGGGYGSSRNEDSNEGRRGNQPHGGYSRQDNDETFGAERLNINEDDNEGGRKRYQYGNDY